MTLREAIIRIARGYSPNLGDDAMIAEGEWGYWVGGSTYVHKSSVARLRGGEPLAEIENPQLSVTLGNLVSDGSCNACQTRRTSKVIIVNLRTLSFRVCKRCAKDLIKQVKGLL